MISPVNLDVSASYTNDGAVISTTYPNGAQLTYGFDSMGRQRTLTDTLASPTTVVASALYNASNQITQITYGNSTTENRSYNSLQQLTGIQMPGMNMQYVYSATNNNGQITQAIDLVSGEQITYQYDSLKRLVSAASSTTGSNPVPIWGQTFGYDGFGNLTDMNPTVGSSPPLHQVVDPHNNQITPGGYDPNGNPTSSGYLYDVENRLTSASSYGANYGPDNKRIFSTVSGNGSPYGNPTQISVYGIDGKLAMTYVSNNMNGTFGPSNQYRYFAGKLVAQGLPTNYAVGTDRLGSVRYTNGATMRFYPYGQDFAGNALSDQKKFGTYTRDAVSGLDYAEQRYYNGAVGRFITPDRFGGSSSITDPGTWNRYSYAGGDPINRNDPTGMIFTLVCGGFDDGGGGAETCGGDGFGLDLSACSGELAFGFEQDVWCGYGTSEQLIRHTSFVCQGWCLMPAALTAADSWLSTPECAGLYGDAKTRKGEFNPETFLLSLFGTPFGNDYGRAGFVNMSPFGPTAITVPTPGGAVDIGTQSISPGAVVGINSTTGAPGTDAWNNGNTWDNAITLLHELGHVYNYILLSGGSRIKLDSFGIGSDSNTDLIKQSCAIAKPTKGI